LSERRPVRSYVLRQGRTSAAQARALEELSPRYAIPFAQGLLDRIAVFGRDAPLVVEIGSGMGESTLEVAAADPATDFVAIEVHGPGVGSLLRGIDAAGLSNVRVVRHDALDVLEQMIVDASLAGIHLFFPDPWPKKRHHKRRLVQPAFAALAARKLVPGGILHTATDWPDYAEQILAVLSTEPLLENTEEGYAPRPARRPRTKFEERGLRLGHPVRDVVFRRRA
jgi:tRNA (guanine-N7-)-methyltransferase